jgi:hypothetical protein
MVTTVPPVIGPEVGVMELITGGRWKLKLSELSVPPRVVILIGTVLTRCDSIYLSIANLCKASRGGGSEIHAGGTRETSAGDSDTIAARSDAGSRKYFCRCGRGDISIIEPQASTSRRCDGGRPSGTRWSDSERTGCIIGKRNRRGTIEV